MYCSKCGAELQENAVFCNRCGQAIGTQTSATQSNIYQQTAYQSSSPNIVKQLSGKIKTEAIIWIIVASLQVIIGLLNIISGIDLYNYYEDGLVNIITGFFVLFVAIVNYVNSSRDFKYSREILTNPIGIVAKFSPIGPYIGNLFYNLIFGGIIGVAGSIFGFITRNFVVSNQQAFRAIETDFQGYKSL